MSAPAELIDAAVVERHRALCAQLAGGLYAICTALWCIREEKTYVAQGFESFRDFLRSIQMNPTSGRLHANGGRILEELRATGDDLLVTSIDLLRPIAQLLSTTKQPPEKQAWVVKRQAQIIRLAAKVAKAGQEPLTEEVVARVASKNFGIKPRGEYRKKKKEPEPQAAWEHPFRKNVRDLLAFAQLQLSGLSPDNAVHYAAVHRLPGFLDLAQWFADVVAESEKLSPDFFYDTGEGSRG